MNKSATYAYGIFAREFGSVDAKCISLHSQKNNALKRKYRAAKELNPKSNNPYDLRYAEVWGPIKLKVNGLVKTELSKSLVFIKDKGEKDDHYFW